MSKKHTYKQFGERAILIEWEAIISEHIISQIIEFKTKILSDKNCKVEDVIVGYNSLTVIFKDFIDFSSKVRELQRISLTKNAKDKAENYIWKIPVCYNVEFGIDLEQISMQSKLSVKEIIQLHTETIYTVYFIGFLPGFLYLGGLNNQLHSPRKSSPRLKVKKGAVAIGGSQTGIYPQESAGGWNIIGNTPISFFNVEKEQPCFVSSEDKIQFVSVDFDEYKRIQIQIKKGEYQLSKTVING